MLPWQPFLAFYIWVAHWRHLKNTTEPSMCGGDAALCQITLTTCYYNYMLINIPYFNVSGICRMKYPVGQHLEGYQEFTEK